MFLHSSWQCDVSKEFLQLADTGTSTDSRAGLPAAVEDHSYLGAESSHCIRSARLVI